MKTMTTMKRYLEGKRSPRGGSMKNVLVLSDVDGTLVRGSLVLNHAVSLHESGLINLGTLPEEWQANPKDELLISSLADTYRSQIAGLHISELQCGAFVGALLENDQNFYSTLQRIVKLKEAGADVRLVSGSPQFLVGNFARRFGFKGVGSTYHRTSENRLSGRVTGMFSAPAKERYVKSLPLDDYEAVISFGDTTSDGPLFDVATHSVLVNPTPHTLTALTGRYHEIVEA